MAFWGENIKEVLERMKRELWVCKPWRPLPAPLGRGCYAEQAGMEWGWGGQGWSLGSCHLSPTLGWRKQAKGNEGAPQSPTSQ